MSPTLSVAILDDHSISVDGYRAQLARDPGLHIAWTISYGQDLVRAITEQAVDVLILDVSVPTSATNVVPYPVLDVLPRLLDWRPSLALLLISMHAEGRLIKSVMQLGAAGYLLKDDRDALSRLAEVIRQIATDEIVLSPLAERRWRDRVAPDDQTLTADQRQLLSACAAHPGETGPDLATRLGLTPAAFRRTLSDVYLRLGVGSRKEAVGEAQRRGWIRFTEPPPG